MYFFSADHHFYHKNIIKYVNRPFESIEHMHDELIKRHNSVVRKEDTVIIAGDFSLASTRITRRVIIPQLNGTLVFLKGCHDKWLANKYRDIWRRRLDSNYVIVCHYCLRTWPSSHYNSWHLYAHSHGRLDSIGKSMDIGVDTHDFYPYSFDEIKEIMANKPDNPNLIRR